MPATVVTFVDSQSLGQVRNTCTTSEGTTHPSENKWHLNSGCLDASLAVVHLYIGRSNQHFVATDPSGVLGSVKSHNWIRTRRSSGCSRMSTLAGATADPNAFCASLFNGLEVDDVA